MEEKDLKVKEKDNYGKPPLRVYNKPIKFTIFDKLQLVLDVDYYDEYIELLSKDEVVANVMRKV